MKTRKLGLSAGACLAVTAAVLAGCGDGDRSQHVQDAAAPTATAPTPAPAPAPAPATSVPATAGDSASAFVKYLAALVGAADETSEGLSIPTLQNVGDDTSPPQSIGS